MSYDIGDKITLTTVVRNAAGTPVNTPTLTIAVTKPDTTAVSPAPSVTNTGANGAYTADIPSAEIDTAGEWTYLWTSTGTVEGTDPGQFTVRAARPYVASMEELKRHLRLEDITDDDEILRDILAAVTDIMEPAVGPVAPTEYTEYVPMRGNQIRPKRRPLVSVTSLTLDQGPAVSSSQYIVDTDASVIRLRTHLCGLYQLVYQAGHQPWPAALKQAGLIICQHEWRVRNPPSSGRMAADQDALAFMPGSGFLIPHRALKLMENYLPALVA